MKDIKTYAFSQITIIIMKFLKYFWIISFLSPFKIKLINIRYSKWIRLTELAWSDAIMKRLQSITKPSFATY